MEQRWQENRTHNPSQQPVNPQGYGYLGNNPTIGMPYAPLSMGNAGNFSNPQNSQPQNINNPLSRPHSRNNYREDNFTGMMEESPYGGIRRNDNKYQDDQQPTLDKQARNAFIKKVYSLLSLQLLVTVGFCFWAMKDQSFKNIFVNVPVIIILSVLLIALSCVIGCCTEFMRKYGLPIFIIFTLIMSVLVGIACAGTKPYIVLTAAGLTAVIVFVLTAYACLTTTDFTDCMPYLLVLSVVLFFFGIMAIFWQNPIVHLIYSCLAALLFSVYLIFDTQMVLGKFSYAYGYDDYYLAAIQLYIDIIQIFLQLLQILSFFNR